MRDFFKSELETLYAKTQLRQYESLSSMPDAEVQIKAMLDALERVCAHYSYIPPEAQKAIVLDRMLKDEDFIGFNAKIVSKWFEQSKGKYFVEEAHKENKPDPNAKPVTYDELKPETKLAVDNLLKALAIDGGGIRSVPKPTPEELKAIETEDELKRGEPTHALPSDPKLIDIHNRKMKAIHDRGLDKLDFRELKAYDIYGKIVHARSKEEAQEIYIEVYE